MSCGFVRDATARAPSGERATLRKPPGSDTRPDAMPCRSNQVSWESVSAVRYTRTSLAEAEKKPPSRKEPTRSATGTGSPASASRFASNGCAMSVPSRRNNNRPGPESPAAAYVETDRVRHQPLRALLVWLRIERPDIAAAGLGRARRNRKYTK